MQCVCGYRKFGERVDRFYLPTATRWRVVAGSGGGCGATPLGLLLGAGSDVTYGRFALPLFVGMRNVVCLSCARVRRGAPTGGGTVMAHWMDAVAVFTVMTDVADAGCMLARFVAADGTSEDSRVDVEGMVVPGIEGTPLETASALPIGAVAASTVYRIPIPDGMEAGLFRLLLVDRCLGTVQRVIELAPPPPP